MGERGGECEGWWGKRGRCTQPSISKFPRCMALALDARVFANAPPPPLPSIRHSIIFAAPPPPPFRRLRTACIPLRSECCERAAESDHCLRCRVGCDYRDASMADADAPTAALSDHGESSSDEGIPPRPAGKTKTKAGTPPTDPDDTADDAGAEASGDECAHNPPVHAPPRTDEATGSLWKRF